MSEPELTRYEYMHCPTCHGGGALQSGKVCPECEGEGRFTADEFAARWPEDEARTWYRTSGQPPDTGVINDGFRPRRRREPGWYEAAIEDGSVRAPGAPDPDEGKVRTGTVINVPLATAGAAGSEG